jgi:glycosyltransferase involved in cell wall biosynthesis
MPPLRNGIADYAYSVAKWLQPSFDQSFACAQDVFAEVPAGVSLIDPAQAFRVVDRTTACLHQIGNNEHHVTVVKSLEQFSGTVVLHDLKLLYLHQLMGLPSGDLMDRLLDSNPTLARSRGYDVAFRNAPRRSDYMLFDCVSRIARAAGSVVVHSEFAKRVLDQMLGRDADGKINVIRHFAFPIDVEPRDVARSSLGLAADDFVVVTAGFATKAKRFDWLIEALSAIMTSRRNIIWVQAGPVRADEYDLERLVQRYPAVARRVRFTGFLDEATLWRYIAASDALVNLRFPSVGESSGILSRAFSIGVPCIVVDTAGYSEFPDDTLIKIPPWRAARGLQLALTMLMDSPGIGRELAERAKGYALAELSPTVYTRRLADILKAPVASRQLGDVEVGRGLATVRVPIDGATATQFALAKRGSDLTVVESATLHADLSDQLDRRDDIFFEATGYRTSAS